MYVEDQQKQSSPLHAISRLTGQSLKAVALVCSVGEEEMESVTACIYPEPSPRFSHALEMEHSYSNALLAFDEPDPPYYGNTPFVDLRQAAFAIGVDRVLCMVSMTSDGKVYGVRDYDGVEMTILTAATEQLTNFQEILQGLVQTHGQNSRLQ